MLRDTESAVRQQGERLSSRGPWDSGLLPTLNLYFPRLPSKGISSKVTQISARESPEDPLSHGKKHLTSIIHMGLDTGKIKERTRSIFYLFLLGILTYIFF